METEIDTEIGSRQAESNDSATAPSVRILAVARGAESGPAVDRPPAPPSTVRGDVRTLVLVVVAFLLILIVFPLTLVAAGQ
jgi:hypothetical protein